MGDLDEARDEVARLEHAARLVPDLRGLQVALGKARRTLDRLEAERRGANTIKVQAALAAGWRPVEGVPLDEIVYAWAPDWEEPRFVFRRLCGDRTEAWIAVDSSDFDGELKPLVCQRLGLLKLPKGCM